MKLMTLLSSIGLIYMGVLGAQWNTPTPITTGRVEFNVRIAYDPGAQSLVAMWVDALNPGFNPVASVSTDHGTTWQPSVVISNLGDSGADIYTAYDPVYQALVAGWTPNASPFSVTTAASTDGGNSWGPAAQITQTDSGLDVCMLYAVNNQSIVATWNQQPTSFPTAAISTDGAASWGSPITITESSTVKYNILTSYNSNTGNIVATWADNTSSLPMSSTSHNDGVTWSADPVQIASNGAVLDVVTLYDPVQNTTLASWADANSHLPTVAISKNDGKKWEAHSVISSTVPAISNVYTSIDPNTGTIIAMWAGATDFLPYYSLSHNGGKTWSAPLAIPNSSKTGSAINVSFDPVANTFVATWCTFTDLSPMYAIYNLSTGASK
jgi:hypothetical protein